MEAARPRTRRRRPRRGTVERPLNTRLVRVSLLAVTPALLALLFSISATGTLPRPTLAPLFDTRSAAALAVELSSRYPSRVPGTVEATNAADWYRGTVSALRLVTEEDVWSETLPDLGRVELRNVVTVVPGRSPETIVLVAPRDNAGADQPQGDNASGTAALIELARGFAPQETAPAPLPQRTLVLVSTDAGAFGGAGSARFARTSPYAADALAAIVLDGIGGGGRPRLAIAGERPSSPARVLVSTASARIAEQVGSAPSLPSTLTQLVDLGIPFAAGEQGPLLAHGIAALTITTQERGDPAVPAGDPDTPLVAEQLGQLGRATETLVGSIDASVGAAFRTHDSLFLDNRAASGWAVRLTLVAAVAPFALGVLDLLVRGRRKRLPFRPAARALRTRGLLLLFGALLLLVGALTDVFPTGAALPPPSYTSFLEDTATAGLALLVILFALGWLAARRRLVPRAPVSVEERLAGYAVALAWLAVVAVFVAVFTPYALVFVLPSLYAWLWLPVRSGPWSRAALYLVGLAGPALGLVVLGRELGLGIVDAPLYAVGLATVGYAPLGSVVLALAWATPATQLGSLAFGRYAPYAAGAEPPPPGLVRASVARIARARTSGR